MALKGSLKDFNLTQLLNLVRLAHKTGSLNIDEGSGPLHIYCQDGRLTHVAANGRSSLLADGLLRSGRVTADQMKLVRPQLAVNTDKELALRLMDAGLVSRDQVMEVIRHETLEILFPAFTWSRGTFVFDSSARPVDDAISLCHGARVRDPGGGPAHPRDRPAGRGHPFAGHRAEAVASARRQDAQHQPVRGPVEGHLLCQWPQLAAPDR